MSADEARQRGLEPLARIASWATAGVDPDDHGHRADPGVAQGAERAGWKVDDLDLVEANEAFAAQACAVNKDIGWDPAGSTSMAEPSPSATRSVRRAAGCW